MNIFNRVFAALMLLIMCALVSCGDAQNATTEAVTDILNIETRSIESREIISDATIVPSVHGDCELLEGTQDVVIQADIIADSASSGQNHNLYDGKYEFGKYNYNTGVAVDTNTHYRNANPIKLDPEKEYNISVKTEYRNNFFYVFIYDSAGRFLEYKSTSYTYPIHVSGAGSINFFYSKWPALYPDEPLHVIVWESKDAETDYTQLLDEREIEKLKQNKARFDGQFQYIAYSKVTGSGGSINTAEHFEWCAKQGFSGLKGDVRPTSDGGLIMCHDAGFSLNDSGYITTYNAENAIVIRDMTEAECLALQHNETLNNVCNFDTFIKICKKYGLIAYITIRDEYIDDVVSAMFAVLDKYDMRNRCIVNSFAYDSLAAVRAIDKDIMLSRVGYSTTTITKDVIDLATSLGNCVVCGFDFPNLGEFEAIDMSVLEYAREKDIRVYEAQVDSMEKLKILKEYGIAGAQITFVPKLK